MAMMQKLGRLDGRHKLSVVMALGAWGVSIYFSQTGFALDAHRAAWLGWFLGCLVTTVELMFNSKTHKLSMTLIAVGIVCYLYGVYTNVDGFWAFQNPGVAFVWNNPQSIMSWFVGLVMEILPEPLFMWGIGADLEGDLIGNIVGLWQGKLEYADPSNQSNQPRQEQRQERPEQHKPQHQYTFPKVEPSGKAKHHKHGGGDRRQYLEQNKGKPLSDETQPKIHFGRDE